MELSKIKKGILDRIGQYKYVLIVILVGMALMQIPGNHESKENELSHIPMNTQNEKDASLELEEILKYIHGAGAVKVLLSEARGEQTLYQTDSTCSEADGRKDTKNQTVIVTDSSRTENGLIYQKNPPVYLGAVVLAQGADNPSVKLAIVDAVSKLTGLGADKISVIKMK